MKKWFLPLMLFGLIFTLMGCEKSAPKSITQWPINEQCDLNKGACTSSVNGTEITLSVSPHPIPIARPLGIEVNMNGLTAQKIELDISGVNMYMGYNRVALTSTQSGQFVGTSMLAFCTLEKMVWQLTLMIHQPDGSQIQVPFLLDMHTP